MVAGTSKCNQLQVFDATRGLESISIVSKVRNPIYAVCMANSLNRCAFGGGDGQLYIFDIVKNTDWVPKEKK